MQINKKLWNKQENSLIYYLCLNDFELMFLFNKKYQLAVLLAVLVAAILLVFTFYEAKESRKDLLNTLEIESLTLIETLNLGIYNSIQTNNEIENLYVKNLNLIANYISNFENRKTLSNQDLKNIAQEFEVTYISVLDENGKIINLNNDSIKVNEVTEDLLDDIKEVVNGQYQWLDLGIIINEQNEQQMYALARQRNRKSGCILVGYSLKKLVDLRNQFGIGKQIQDIGNNPDIAYIVLQDLDGIFSASKEITQLSSIESDAFLLKVFNEHVTLTRVTKFENENVLEVVAPIIINEEDVFLTRIALSLKNIEMIQSSSNRRVTITSIALFVLSLLLIIFLITRKRYQTLRTEHKKIKQYTELILDNISDAVLALDNTGKIFLFNHSAENLFELNFEKIFNKKYSDIFKGDEFKLNKALQSYVVPEYFEIEYNLNEKGKRILGIAVSSIQNQKGDVELVVALIKDLTDFRQIQKKLEIKEKMTAMGELAAGVAHEIRNPLNSISVIAQRFEFEFEPKEQEEEYTKLVKTVRSEVARVNQIIKQFLDFAKPAKLNLRNFNLSDVLNEVINIIESQAEEKKIKINRNFADIIEVKVDSEKIKQAFLNIMLNSIQSIENNGVISISVKQTDKLIIDISDNGIGISKENQTKIFNLYYSTKNSGTGIGLSIVYQIISEHNGEIICESEEGKGTTMRIILPKNS
ncbi:MAG TPA: ATP-binding protein [Candidatus Kapabacteria bacterium]|nr:ATP-binding protein [Candidatus Kapabacteria bacterium]HPO61989.1 ATP-binding protein [Candidatus Kapabacteria bacterium]